MAIILGNYSFDILTFSETGLDPTIENTLLAIEGYNLFRQDRMLRVDPGRSKRGGGLAMYIKSKCVTNTDKFSRLNVCTVDCEIQIITVKACNDRESIIINVYHPPDGNTENFIEKVTSILDIVVRERYADVYLLGDINMNHLKEANNNVANNIINLFKTYGLTQRIEKPTCRTMQSKSLIDAIYVRSNKSLTSFILPIAMSDHYLVGTSRYLKYTSEPKREILGRSYRSYSLNAVRN